MFTFTIFYLCMSKHENSNFNETKKQNKTKSKKKRQNPPPPPTSVGRRAFGRVLRTAETSARTTWPGVIWGK